MKISMTRVKDFVSGEKGRKILLFGGAALLILLLLSTLFGGKTETKTTVKTENSMMKTVIQKVVTAPINTLDFFIFHSF